MFYCNTRVQYNCRLRRINLGPDFQIAHGYARRAYKKTSALCDKQYCHRHPLNRTWARLCPTMHCYYYLSLK